MPIWHRVPGGGCGGWSANQKHIYGGLAVLTTPLVLGAPTVPIEEVYFKQPALHILKPLPALSPTPRSIYVLLEQLPFAQIEVQNITRQCQWSK